MTGARSSSILAFVWRHSRLQQCFLLFLTFISFPIVYASLEVPKIIVNDAISGADFPRMVFGIAIDQIPYLLALSLLFLLLVLLNNGLKWVINVGLGTCGERLLCRLRYELTERIERFPAGRLRSARQGETIQSVMGEVEPLGGFFGEVIVTPIFQGGLLAVYVGFIFMQDVWLGIASIAFYPVQTLLVPMLQAKVVALNRERASGARVIADRVGDMMRLAPDIRSNGTSAWHLAELARLLGRNAAIRQAIFYRKFTIKFLVNFLNQLTPFFFYSIGGYLVIVGSLDFGALVAVLAAYKDLAGPWKALLGYVQRLSDFSGRYRYVREGFETDDLLAPAPAAEPEIGALQPPLVLSQVEADPSIELPEIERLRLDAGETLVVVGGSQAAREALIQLAAGLSPPAGGTVSLGGADLRTVPWRRIGRSVGLLSASPGIAPITLRDNLVYGLLRGPVPSDPVAGLRRAEAQETAATVTSWSEAALDLEAAGVAGLPELETQILDLCERFGVTKSLVSIGLGRTLSPPEIDRWGDTLMALKAEIGADLGAVSDLIEPWEVDAYNTNAPLLANLLFALPVAPARSPAEHAASPSVQALLHKLRGETLLLEIGWKIARVLSEISGAVDESSHLLDRLPGFSRQDILDSATIVGSRKAAGPRRLRRAQRARLQALAANFVQTRDKLDVLDAETTARVLAFRSRALAQIRRSDAFVALDAPRYQPGLTVADNILPGIRRLDRKSQWHRIDGHLEAAIAGKGMTEDLYRIGMDTAIAEAGLPAAVVRRIGLVRAILKRPNVLLIAGGSDLHPQGEAAAMAALRDCLPKAGLLLATETSEAAHPGEGRIARITDRGRLEEGPG